jgi:hypothetical protein
MVKTDKIMKTKIVVIKKRSALLFKYYYPFVLTENYLPAPVRTFRAVLNFSCDCGRLFTDNFLVYPVSIISIDIFAG